MTPAETYRLVETWQREHAQRLALFNTRMDDANALTTDAQQLAALFTAARNLRIAAGQLEEATRAHVTNLRQPET